MSEELSSAVERLYQCFSFYPCRPTIEGCPCCVSNTDKEKIHSKQLRQLDGDDLSRYAAKAMTTRGGVEDFKHFLPRIFELVAIEDPGIDLFSVAGKLEYGQWENWPELEREAIIAFLYAWWPDFVKSNYCFDQEIFVILCRLTQDIDAILGLWKISFKDNSFNNFVELVLNYSTDLFGKRKDFKDLDDESVEKLIDWIKKNSTVLESGFFHYETRDKLLAERASAALYVFERMTSTSSVNG